MNLYQLNLVNALFPRSQVSSIINSYKYIGKQVRVWLYVIYYKIFEVVRVCLARNICIPHSYEHAEVDDSK
jgi:hypothetical protein